MKTMNVKETLEQCLFAWKEVKKSLERMHFTTTTKQTGKETFGAYFYLQAIADQEIKALQHDLKELGEGNDIQGNA